MAQKVLSGHRVKVSVFDPRTGRSRVIGIYKQASWDIAYGAQPVFILGKTAAAALQYTHAEPITFRLTAWRIDEHGPYTDANLPPLRELLTNEYVRLAVLDRQREIDGKDAVIGEITDVIVTGANASYSIQQLSDYSVNGMGIMHHDESTRNVEHATATQLP